jgi:hypothetical protein
MVKVLPSIALSASALVLNTKFKVCTSGIAITGVGLRSEQGSRR